MAIKNKRTPWGSQAVEKVQTNFAKKRLQTRVNKGLEASFVE